MSVDVDDVMVGEKEEDDEEDEEAPEEIARYARRSA
jgi:hypothetical protein